MRIFLSLFVILFATSSSQLFALSDEAIEEITERLESSSTDELIERREEILSDLESDEEDIDISENPEEMGKKLGEACLKFHAALKEKYEGTTENSDIPVDTDLKAIANKIFSPMKMYIYEWLNHFNLT